jgi:hypothetical protein
LHLFDLKSWALHLTLEELGVASPERFVFTIRTRETIPTLSCPNMIYTIIMRNFDPVSFEPSAYINGNLYTYIIEDICSPARVDGNVAVTVNHLVDPKEGQFFSTVASEWFVNPYGAFVTSLSRDDVGALHYTLGTNNINFESLSRDSTLFYTNQTQPQLLATTNFALFASQAFTNDAPTLLGLYPNLVITASSNWFGIATNVIITPFFTNSPYDPFGTLPHLAFSTNIFFTPQTFYRHTLGNVFTVVSTNGVWTSLPLTDVLFTRPSIANFQTATVTPFNSPYNPLGTFTIQTNIVNQRPFVTNTFSGEYFILPTTACDVQILYTLLTYVTAYTNVLGSSTNTVTVGGGGTTNNPGTGTNVITQASFNLVTYSTNHTFVVNPVNCLVTNVTLRTGMDHIQFLRTSYDSLLGRFFQPITNIYNTVMITNSLVFPQKAQRVVLRPDILYGAQDQQGTALANSTTATRTPTGGTFNTNNELATLAGPGNIDPTGLAGPHGGGIEIIFNRVGPLIINEYFTNAAAVLGNEFGLSQAESFPFGTNFIWASFDGSPADPILYPQGTSMAALENEIIFQITTAALPDATGNVPYSQPIQFSGGQAPYSWAPAPGSSPLPAGLSLASDGTVSGTPLVTGTFAFTVTLSDASARTTTRTISITIHP